MVQFTLVRGSWGGLRLPRSLQPRETESVTRQPRRALGCGPGLEATTGSPHSCLFSVSLPRSGQNGRLRQRPRHPRPRRENRARPRPACFWRIRQTERLACATGFPVLAPKRDLRFAAFSFAYSAFVSFLTHGFAHASPLHRLSVVCIPRRFSPLALSTFWFLLPPDAAHLHL